MRARGFVASLALFLAACGGSSSTQEDAGVQEDAAVQQDGEAPDATTRVEQQLAWFIQMINGGGTLEQSEYEALFSAEYRAACDLACFTTDYFSPLATTYAPLTVTGAESTATENAEWARVHAEGNDYWFRIFLAVNPSDGKVTNLSIPFAPDLDPEFGVLPAGQVGFYLYDPYQARTTAGFTVELIDRTTGLSFSPAVTGTTDSKYHYARLAVPTGQTEVAVKATHSSGQVTYTYSSLLVAGADRLWVPVYPSGAFPYYGGRVSQTLTAGKAQLWGILQWAPPAEAWAVDSWNSGIGCATVAATPALPNVYYTAPPSYLPTTTATQTALQNSTFYSFNLEPVAHVVTTTATGAGTPLSLSLPPLAVDAVTVAMMSFDRATYPTNPTAAGCTP